MSPCCLLYKCMYVHAQYIHVHACVHVYVHACAHVFLYVCVICIYIYAFAHNLFDPFLNTLLLECFTILQWNSQHFKNVICSISSRLIYVMHRVYLYQTLSFYLDICLCVVLTCIEIRHAKRRIYKNSQNDRFMRSQICVYALHISFQIYNNRCRGIQFVNVKYWINLISNPWLKWYSHENQFGFNKAIGNSNSTFNLL